MDPQFTRPKPISRSIMPLAERRYVGPATLPRPAVNSTVATPPQKSSTPRGWLNRVGPKQVSLALAGLAVTVLIAVVSTHSLRSPNVLSANITKQISYGVYYPKDQNQLAVDPESIVYNPKAAVLSFTARLADNKLLNINQQATPQSFVDIPQAYDKLISSLQPYASFESLNGRVSLTHPKELKGSQSAVLNAKGTLLFARSNAELTENQWKQVFNSLQIRDLGTAK